MGCSVVWWCVMECGGVWWSVAGCCVAFVACGWGGEVVSYVLQGV